MAGGSASYAPCGLTSGTHHDFSLVGDCLRDAGAVVGSVAGFDCLPQFATQFGLGDSR
jgi:hypothetical protein